MAPCNYAIVMFAYNEEQNIQSSLDSLFAAINPNFTKLTVIANGCSDNTANIVRDNRHRFGRHRLSVVELAIGDKCNAWNHYIHVLAGNESCHFFVDADVTFSEDCFGRMSRCLNESAQSYNIVAGVPLSGRNQDYYQSLITDRSCFFGNLYGARYSYLQLLREKNFRLPIGLNWIDSFLTKAANTDLNFGPKNLPNRVTYCPGVGYYVDSLSPLRLEDIRLYLNRIARYELGKIQELYLDALTVESWPKTLDQINTQIWSEFSNDAVNLSLVKRWLVRRRLKRFIDQASKEIDHA
ncbi:glycosyltransferase family A protein [Congregibacter variabilis]|uniref:Glycosyltransferase family A protein n=1 Tax=Congregibacter variabilis TaxID=3081200 RepID=A0ABZ0I7N2_9GAMM|nr:glycosyltransferase family A protein [Congregibacter sp. IMCC43200]